MVLLKARTTNHKILYSLCCKKIRKLFDKFTFSFRIKYLKSNPIVFFLLCVFIERLLIIDI